MYQTDHLTLFRKLFEWSNVEATDIDETRYAVAKKLSEVCTVLFFFCSQTPVKLKEVCS